MKNLLIIALLTNIAYGSEKCITKSEGFKGKGILTFSWFSIKLYEIAYYKSQDKETLKLNFKKDISAYYLNQGWDEGLKSFEENEKNKVAMKWLKKNSPDAKEDDCLEYHKLKTGEVELVYNNKKLAQTKNKEVFDMVFYPWIGDIPVDIELKGKLLGN